MTKRWGVHDLVALVLDADSFECWDEPVDITGHPAAYRAELEAAAEKAVAVPNGVDDHTAAALLLQGYTAHFLCNSTFPVGPEHTVLLHAGAGGVGLLLTQLLKAKGARVITTAGSDSAGPSL